MRLISLSQYPNFLNMTGALSLYATGLFGAARRRACSNGLKSDFLSKILPMALHFA